MKKLLILFAFVIAPALATSVRAEPVAVVNGTVHTMGQIGRAHV